MLPSGILGLICLLIIEYVLSLQVGELEAQKSVLKKQRSFIREESSAEDGLQEDGRVSGTPAHGDTQTGLDLSVSGMCLLIGSV